MLFRLLFLLTLILALAAGPVGNAGGCATRVGEMKCGHCCADRAADCCAKGSVPARETTPLATTSSDLKQAIVPALACLAVQPAIVPPPVSVRAKTPVIRPAQARVEVTCIRLI